MASPLTATIAYTAKSNIGSATVTIAPQTTPFTPADYCKPSAWCNIQSSAMSTATGCNFWDGVNSTNNRPFLEGCSPDGYSELFFHQQNWNEITSLGLPGTACMSGWTAACTPTLTISQTRFTQTWCCPAGGWGCATGTGPRKCISMLSTPTTVWVNKAIPMGATVFETYVLPSRPPESPVTLHRPPFPLQAQISQQVMQVDSSSSTQTVSAASTAALTSASATSISSTSAHELTDGAIAGIVIGAVAVALLGIIAVALCMLRRRNPNGRRDAGKFELPTGTEETIQRAPVEVAEKRYSTTRPDRTFALDMPDGVVFSPVDGTVSSPLSHVVTPMSAAPLAELHGTSIVDKMADESRRNPEMDAYQLPPDVKR